MRYFLLALCLFLTTGAWAQDWAQAALARSPRHGEWVKVKQGARTVQCWVVYPEIKGKAPVVLVIHEIFGLTDWVRLVADQLAAAGYLAIAPDLLSSPQGGTKELGGDDAARKAIADLPPDQITADLKAAAAYATKLPAANGARLAVAGFCWGGAQSFRFATNDKALKLACVFYGTPPEEGLDRIVCPVAGFYAENDNRVNATLEDTKARMKKAGQSFDPAVYPGAGHGFMRAGQAPDASAANQAAQEKGWARLLELLKKM